MNNKNSIILSIVVLALCALLIISTPCAPMLDFFGHQVLAIVLATIAIWIFKPFNLSFALGGFFLAACCLALGMPTSIVFSGFTQSAIWTLIPALFFGFVLQKTGVGKRIAMGVIRLIRPSILNFMLAWVFIGVVLSMLTPSITVRVAIIIPIAVHCTNLCKFELNSKANSLIMLTAFSMALLPGGGWLNGALWGPIIQGMFNSTPGMEGIVTFDSWLKSVFVPMEIATLIVIAGSYLVLKPSEKLDISAIEELKKQKEEPLTRHEKITIIILIGVFISFITSSIHGFPDATICIGAVFLFFLFGIIQPSEFSSGIGWDIVVFFSMSLSLTAIFSEAGISEWLSNIIVPALEPLVSNNLLFVLGITAILFLWRFIDVALFIPTMAILTPVIPAISQAYSISPLVWIAIYVMAGNVFFMSYQNMWVNMAQAIAKERSWTSKHLAVYGTIYFIGCLIALSIAVPMWESFGYFG